MLINFKTKNYELDADIKMYAEEKVHALEKFVQNAQAETHFDIELSQDTTQQSGDIYRTDIVVQSGAVDMHAVGHGESMQAAIDIARDELAQRLSRAADRERSLFRKGARAIKRMLRWGS